MIPIANPEFGSAEKQAVADVLDSGIVADGPEVREFESEFADYCGANHAVAAANGTAALHAALEGVGIGEGDRVVTTPFSFVASANAIRLAGATPVFADIDPVTYNLDPHAAETAVREFDADAILLVHLYGLPAEMDAFRDIADDEDVKLIEDAAQAHGARYDGDHVGTFGDAAAFSFYPTKNMTTAEGGMVLTNDEGTAARTASYVNHGRTEEGGYSHLTLGHNYRMTSLAAAIGRAQLAKLPEWVETRRENASVLTEALENVAGVAPPIEPEGRTHAYHQYTVRCEDRDGLKEALAEAGVGTGIYYPTTIPDLGAYDDDVAICSDGYYNARRAAEDVLSLPVHPKVTSEDCEEIVEAVENAVAQTA